MYSFIHLSEMHSAVSLMTTKNNEGDVSIPLIRLYYRISSQSLFYFTLPLKPAFFNIFLKDFFSFDVILGSFIFDDLGTFLNAFFKNLVFFDLTVIVFSLAQFSKACFPTFVTLFGTVILPRTLQPLNALSAYVK